MRISLDIDDPRLLDVERHVLTNAAARILGRADLGSPVPRELLTPPDKWNVNSAARRPDVL